MTVDPSARPDAVLISNLLSLSAVQISLSRKNALGEITKGASASAFLWEASGDLYLVTNWHNVCGWDPIKNRALSEQCFTPNCIQVTVELGKTLEDGRIKRDFRDAVLDLFDEDNKPRWLEHPIFGNRVDVVAVKIGEIGDAQLSNRPINTYPEFVDYDVVVGDDAFVVGYPLGLDGGPRLPIWKRASIATEPHYDLEGLPKLLIDTATRQGMSGSPVIAVRRGLTTPRNAKGPGDNILGLVEIFLGVYSGRLGDDSLGAQLGIVWKASVVDEIVREGKPGRTPF